MRPCEPALRIEDHAVLGDTRTMALVGTDGSVDWLCLPRFDSAACFAALLGDESHGRWQVCPRGLSDGVVVRTSQRYRGDSLVLETEWETATGVVRVVDAMPVRPEHVGGPGDHADVVRRVEGVRGEVEMALRWTVRFAYGAATPWVRRATDGEGRPCLLAVAGPDAVVLRGDLLPEPDRRGAPAHHAHFLVREGEAVDLAMTWYPSHQAVPHLHPVAESIDATVAWWEQWSARTAYDGPHAGLVRRSLLTLKALTYAPTGGIVAAATTSLPEKIGGSRNWDYRFTWLRDATLTLQALLTTGHLAEAADWDRWMLRAVAGSPQELQIMYGLAGERSLPELELPHLPGYEGSLPVRIGNEAATQFQLDVYGEVMAAVHLAACSGLEAEDGTAWAMQRALLAHLETVLDRTDAGIWEVRGRERVFTHSRVMAWVAFDRAVRMVEELGREGPVEHWRGLRDRLHAEVCEQGWDDGAGAFTQYYGGTELDASLLVLPLVGFLPGTDERVRSTVRAVEAALRVGPLVDRYETGSGVDGLDPGEGSFLACSFWLVSALVHVGREDEARALFDELAALANHVGLYAEEYDGPAQRHVGNFPQAFSSLALVEAAVTLAACGSGSAAPGTRAGTRA